MIKSSDQWTFKSWSRDHQMAKINRSENFPNRMLMMHGYVSDVNVYLDRGGKGLIMQQWEGFFNNNSCDDTTRYKGYKNSHRLIQACTLWFKFRSSWNGSPTGSALSCNPEAWLSTVRWVANISKNVERAVRVRGLPLLEWRWQTCTNVWWSSQSEQACWHFMPASFAYHRGPTLIHFHHRWTSYHEKHPSIHTHW